MRDSHYEAQSNLWRAQGHNNKTYPLSTRGARAISDTIASEYLRENQTVFVRGKVTFSRIFSKFTGRELKNRIEQQRKLGYIYVTTRPYRTISIVDAYVVHADENTPTLEEQYVKGKIFTHKKGRNTGRKGYSIEDTSQVLPLVYEPVPEKFDHIRLVKLEGELANNLDVTLVLRTFQPGKFTKKGMTLSRVILNEPIQYYTQEIDVETLGNLGIIIDHGTEHRESKKNSLPSSSRQENQLNLPFDSVSTFPEFYHNPVIQLLANQPRWTVSSREKKPINIRELLHTGRLWGAHEVSEKCLITLEELTRFMPEMANATFHINAQSDGVMVLDIEKSCPPELATELLKLPALYVERSMSGLGYHLLMPIPNNFWDFPIAANKPALKGPSGHFEVLQRHWVIFTRNVEPSYKQDTVPTAEQSQKWEELWVKLAQSAVETPMADFEVDFKEPEIPQKESLLASMVAQPRTKSLADFSHDTSRFEFSVLSVLYRHMRARLNAERITNPSLSWDENQMVWLLYQAAKQVLPYRPKHDTLRNGHPYLFNQAQRYVALSLAREAGAGS